MQPDRGDESSARDWPRRRAGRDVAPPVRGRRANAIAWPVMTASPARYAVASFRLEDLAGLPHEPGKDRQLLNRIHLEETIPIRTQRRPDPFDPGARVLGQLDARPIARRKARVPSQLQPLERRGDETALHPRAPDNSSAEAAPPNSSIVMHARSRRSSARISAATRRTHSRSPGIARRFDRSPG